MMISYLIEVPTDQPRFRIQREGRVKLKQLDPKISFFRGNIRGINQSVVDRRASGDGDFTCKGLPALIKNPNSGWSFPNENYSSILIRVVVRAVAPSVAKFGHKRSQVIFFYMRFQKCTNNGII